MSDYSDLEKLARNATPGPWTAYDTHGKRFIERVGTEDHVVCETPKRQWLRDSEYIAAANPVVVLGLIEESRAAQSELAALREELAKEKRNTSALREKVGAITNKWSNEKNLKDKAKGRFDAASKRLSAAEQRNSDLIDLIQKAHTWVDRNNFGGWDAYELRDQLAAAMNKPTESGASK